MPSKLINEPHLTRQQQPVVVAQLVLEVCKMAVNGVGRVWDAQFMAVILCEQPWQVVADTPVRTSQSLVGVEGL